MYWQYGDSDTAAAREFYQELLRGIASADPATIGLYEVPDLTARWDYERGNLAADLRLAPGDPALARAAQAYLAAAREEFWLEAARLARQRLTPGAGERPGTRTRTAPSPKTRGTARPAPDWRQDITDPATGLSRLLSERCPTCILRLATRCTSAPSGPPRSSGRSLTPAPTSSVMTLLPMVTFPTTGLRSAEGSSMGTVTGPGPADPAGGQTADRGPAARRRQGGGTRPGRRQGSRHGVFDGNTPNEAYSGCCADEDGDPAVLDATEPPAIDRAGYTEDDFARDLGIDPRDHALPRAMSAYADAFADASGRKPNGPPASTRTSPPPPPSPPSPLPPPPPPLPPLPPLLLLPPPLPPPPPPSPTPPPPPTRHQPPQRQGRRTQSGRVEAGRPGHAGQHPPTTKQNQKTLKKTT